MQQVMDFYKECSNSYRYQAANKDEHIQSFYIRKAAFNEQPPKSISIIVNGLEA